MIKRIYLFTVFLCALVFCYSNLSASNFADTYGFSAEGIARGNSMTAVVKDWSSVYYNIAGLGRSKKFLAGGVAVKSTNASMSLKLRKKDASDGGKSESEYANQLAISIMYTLPQLNLSIQRYATDGAGTITAPVKTNAAKISPYGFLVIGAVLDLNVFAKLPKFISSARFGIGLGANADGTLVKVNDLDPRTHNFLRYGREAQKSMILTGLGFGFLNDSFGFGIGVNVSFNGEGKVTMDANITGDPQIPIQQSKMDLGISPGIVAGVYLAPGQLSALSFLQGLEIGASFRQQTDMEIYPFPAKAAIAGGVINMDLYLDIYDYFQPHIITTGIAYTRWGVTLSFDAEYHMWSMYKESIAKRVNYAGTPKLRDIIIYRCGIKYHGGPWWELMAGYYYQPSILAAYTESRFNYLDNDKHGASAGAAFIIPKMGPMGGVVPITISYQFQYLVRRSVPKYAFSTDEQYYNPTYSYGGMNHTIMLEVGMKL